MPRMIRDSRTAPVGRAARGTTRDVKIIDPVTRLEGHLKITVRIGTVGGVQQVIEAAATGTLFRGFESILVGRQPGDAQHITQRICGVCPVSHGLAAVEAADALCGVTPPNNARVMRNLVLGANYLHSHLLHFYHLAAPDFLDGPPMPPWQPTWNVDKRLDQATNDLLIGHYVAALDMRRKAHELGALFGGRMPHPPTYLPGGFTTTPRPERIAACRSYLNELIPFIEGTYLPDVQYLGSVYDDYFGLGTGHANLLAYGVFDLDATGNTKLLQRGRVVANTTIVQPVDVTQITEQVTRSWYAESTNNLNPAAGATVPQYPKRGAYSWLKAPRYTAVPYEVGALARMWVNGDYQSGVSVMDRHAARAYETLKVARAMQQWVDELSASGPVYTRAVFPLTGSASGLTEAPRGALGHWVGLANGLLAHYQVVTPTCWNASPRDMAGVRGPIEQALLGTPVRDPNQPIEVLRVIHSFDPCLSCAVHVMRPGEEGRVFRLGHSHGETETTAHDHRDESGHD